MPPCPRGRLHRDSTLLIAILAGDIFAFDQALLGLYPPPDQGPVREALYADHDCPYNSSLYLPRLQSAKPDRVSRSSQALLYLPDTVLLLAQGVLASVVNA
jgi:hypothetical protein